MPASPTGPTLVGRCAIAEAQPSPLSAHERMARVASGNLKGQRLAGDLAPLLRDALAAAVARRADGRSGVVRVSGALISAAAVALLDRPGRALLAGALARRSVGPTWQEACRIGPGGAHRHPEIVRLFVESGRVDVNGAVWEATWQAHLPALAHLLACGASADADGMNVPPLHAAISASHRDQAPAVVALLLAHGADPNRINRATSRSPLTALAQRSDRTHTLLPLLHDAGARLDDPDRDGQTPLAAAISAGNTVMVDLLLARGARLDVPGWGGITPLMEAARRHDAAIVARLLAAGASPTPRDPSGRAAAHALVNPIGAAAVLAALCAASHRPEIP